MNTQITTRHVDVTDHVREYAEKRAAKLERFYDGIVSSHIILSESNSPARKRRPRSTSTSTRNVCRLKMRPRPMSRPSTAASISFGDSWRNTRLNFEARNATPTEFRLSIARRDRDQSPRRTPKEWDVRTIAPVAPPVRKKYRRPEPPIGWLRALLVRTAC